MKKYLLVLTAVLFTNKIIAQEKLNLKEGQTLEYTVSAGGGIFPMIFDIDSLSDSRVEFSWRLSQSKGRFIINKSSLDSANENYWEQPRDFEELTIPASQNLLMISRYLFKVLKQNKKVVFDGALLSLREVNAEPFIMNGKTIDAIYAESGSGLRIWILNNQATPLILRLANNPYMVDATLDNIKHNIKIFN